MQALTREIGFSETVFVLPPEQGGTARIRIFNPGVEMRFAGHPTLGAAFVLGAPLQRGVIELETLAGIVPVALERDESGAIVFGRMMQPVPRVEAVEDPDGVLAAIGAERSALPIELYDNGARHIVVMLDDVVRARASHARRRRDRGARDHRRQRIRAVGGRLAEPDVLGARGGSRNGVGRRPDRLPPRAPRPASPGARRS